MGRTTSIIISTNRTTKTQQKQTVWFGDGEIRLNGETGQYIGKYEKNGAWWNAEVHFGGEVKELSQPTATQAAQAVAWAWLACKALQGFAEAAAKLLADMDWEKRIFIDVNAFVAAATEKQAREAAAEDLWQEYRAKDGWYFAEPVVEENSRDNAKRKIFVFNAAENIAFFTTKDGQLHREADAEPHFVYVCVHWANCTIAPYVGEIWAYFFHTRTDAIFESVGLSFGDFLDLFKAVVPFDELETPEQVYAWLIITETRNYLDIPKDVLKVYFRWKLSYYKYGCHIESRREEQRTIIATCTP